MARMANPQFAKDHSRGIMELYTQPPYCCPMTQLAKKLDPCIWISHQRSVGQIGKLPRAQRDKFLKD